MGTQGRAYLCGAGAVLLWSTVASAFKIALGLMDYAQLLLYASFASIILLGAILAARGRLREVTRSTRAEYLRSLRLGVLNPFLYYLVLFRAYELLPAQIAQPLNYTWALTLAYLSVPLLGQRLGRRDVAAGVVCYGGVAVISAGGHVGAAGAVSPAGVALALGSTVLWSLYWIGHTRDRRDPVVSLFLSFVFGFPLVVAYCLVFSDLRVSSAALLAGAYVGVVEMGVAFVLWLSALRLSENASRVANLIFLSPFISLLFIRRFVGERILFSTVVGLVLVVAGLLIQSSVRSRERVA